MFKHTKGMYKISTLYKNLLNLKNNSSTDIYTVKITFSRSHIYKNKT